MSLEIVSHWLLVLAPKIMPLIGSLIAILLLARMARWMGLGTEYRRIEGEISAIRLANEAECGFDAVAADVDGAGYGAIVRNAEGAMMLVRVHGNQFVARRLDRSFTTRLDRNRLHLTSPEWAFGSVDLDFGDQAAVIASRMRMLP
jgi:uncharacterized Rossmann fold enzyme